MLRFCALLLATWTLAFTDPRPASAENRVALVIGNASCAHTTPLTNTLNDARDMSSALKSIGFDVAEALYADKSQLDNALRSFADKLAGADVALFFYAGHGLQIGRPNYLVPIDAKLKRERDLQFEAVGLDFVIRQMEIDREGKTTIIMLNACRDNPLARNLARSMGTRSTAIGRGLAATATGLGTFINYATRPGNVALDGEGRNSPFTTALTKHMMSKGRNLNATMIALRNEVVAAYCFPKSTPATRTRAGSAACAAHLAAARPPPFSCRPNYWAKNRPASTAASRCSRVHRSKATSSSWPAPIPPTSA